MNSSSVFLVKAGGIKREYLINQYGQIHCDLTEMGKKAEAVVIDPILYLCDTESCPAVDSSGKPIYEDAAHLCPIYVRGYDGLVDMGYQKHFRVEHGQNEFANRHSHINGIESFWAFAKTRLVRFRGLAKHTFYFHLKECEFRFNHRNEDIYKLVLKMLRENPLC